mmetsp:Transcript_93502/g.150968  ORF Transcript_93502/g.150968 Transcript_93502/m.150968 type:complete len:98 (-) Transcript_93502:695-988(-)
MYLHINRSISTWRVVCYMYAMYLHDMSCAMSHIYMTYQPIDIYMKCRAQCICMTPHAQCVMQICRFKYYTSQNVEISCDMSCRHMCVYMKMFVYMKR